MRRGIWICGAVGETCTSLIGRVAQAHRHALAGVSSGHEREADRLLRAARCRILRERSDELREPGPVDAERFCTRHYLSQEVVDGVRPLRPFDQIGLW